VKERRKPKRDSKEYLFVQLKIVNLGWLFKADLEEREVNKIEKVDSPEKIEGKCSQYILHKISPKLFKALNYLSVSKENYFTELFMNNIKEREKLR